VKNTFDKAQGPAISPLLKAFHGPVDALMVNSVFWDIGRLVTGSLGRKSGREICSDPNRREEYVESWAHNASHLIRAIEQYFPLVKWKAWRTANFIQNPLPPCRNDLVRAMNRESHHIARKHNMLRMDLSSFRGVMDNMRDSHHPNSNVTAAFMQAIIENIKTEIVMIK
jgi:hypothetical protein